MEIEGKTCTREILATLEVHREHPENQQEVRK